MIPISLQLMSKPYIISCGHMFERQNIYMHIVQRRNIHCPLCRSIVSFDEGLIDIQALRIINQLRQQIAAQQMKHKICVFVRYQQMTKTRYFSKEATLYDLMLDICEITCIRKIQSLQKWFSLLCNGKSLNYLYRKEQKLILNLILNNNSTVNVERIRYDENQAIPKNLQKLI